MKKLVLTLGLCLVAVVCFGQKKTVAEALKLAKDAKPNFAEARTKIKAALDHPETKDDPKTWFTAGQIENFQFDKENTKQILGQQPNEAVMYEALFVIFPYFEKAYTLDLVPDAKGKVKPKYAKDMKAITKVNMPYYMNGGIYYWEKQDYKKAFEFFDQYVTITDSRLMKEGEAANATAPVDSNYIYAVYYASLAATMISDSELTIKSLKRASKQDFKQNEVFQYLSQSYQDINDMENYEKTLNEAFALFPKDTWFIINLIKIYVDSERNDKAMELIQTAIKNDPSNFQLFDLAGNVYEILKDYKKAEEYFLKSIELNSENAETQFNIGRIYFNQGVVQLDIANDITDVKKYNEEKEKAKAFFRKALPYFEKSYQLNPDSMELKITLRSIYYNLDMGDKYNEMDKIIGDN